MNLRIMMRRLNKRNLWLLLLPFLLAACQSYKKVPYFQNVEVVNEVEQQEKLYDAKIMPKDLLTIVVSCTNPELAIPFNLTVASQQKAYISIQKLQQSYVTDNINEELSAALTKLTETEYQVKTAKETMNLANENLDLVSFSYNEGKANMVDVLSAQLSWTQAHTNLINAYLSEKMAVAEYRKVISE